MLTWLSKHSKNERIVFAATAIGTAVALFLLQAVANRPFSQTVPQEQVRPPRQLLEMRPASLFQDEFFTSPFLIDSELLQLKDEMDQQMEEFQQEFIGTPLLRGAAPSMMFWDADIFDDDNMVTMVMTIPDGLGADNINIEIIDGAVMSISGGIIDPMDRAKSHFEKRFALGRNVEQDKIEANLKDGKLTVNTPKVGHSGNKETRRKIPIKDEL